MGVRHAAITHPGGRYGYYGGRYYGTRYPNYGRYYGGYYGNYPYGAAAAGLATGAVIGAAAAYPYSYPYSTYQTPVAATADGGYCATPARTCTLTSSAPVGTGCPAAPRVAERVAPCSDVARSLVVVRLMEGVPFVRPHSEEIGEMPLEPGPPRFQHLQDRKHMRQVITLALVPIFAATPALAGAGVTTTSVNFRSGPGTAVSSIRTLPAGTAVDSVSARSPEAGAP